MLNLTFYDRGKYDTKMYDNIYITLKTKWLKSSLVQLCLSSNLKQWEPHLMKHNGKCNNVQTVQ